MSDALLMFGFLLFLLVLGMAAWRVHPRPVRRLEPWYHSILPGAPRPTVRAWEVAAHASLRTSHERRGLIGSPAGTPDDQEQ